jgi:hypothetical protein
MGVGDRQGYARGNVAGALAPFDVERALARVEPVKDEYERDRYFGFIAAALADTDPKRGLAVAEKISERSVGPHFSKVAIIYSLGRADRSDEAARAIREMKGYWSAKYQVDAYAWLAVAVAPHDRARAATFIDRALAIPVDSPGAFLGWSNSGGGTTEAAWTAACAKRAGYPDMAGVIARVLASRPPTRYSDMSQETRSQAVAAVALALTDPGAALQFLRDLEARSGEAAPKFGRFTDPNWLIAWALTDPKHAEELFDAELASFQGQRDVNLQFTGVLQLAEVLAQPRQRREESLRSKHGATWYPGLDL